MNIYRFFFPPKDPQEVLRKYNIPQKVGWKIQMKKEGLVATSDDFPGLVTNAKTPEALLEMINDAVLEYYDIPKRESDFIFDELDLAGQGVVYLKHERKKQLA